MALNTLGNMHRSFQRDGDMARLSPNMTKALAGSKLRFSGEHTSMILIEAREMF